MQIVPAMAAEANTIDYVAIGDSVAAGVRGGKLPLGDPNYEKYSDEGYTDDIANALRTSGILRTFDEKLCVSGATAAGLVEILSDPANYAQVQYLLGNADIVTLDIGANDVLNYKVRVDNTQISFYQYVFLHKDEIQSCITYTSTGTPVVKLSNKIKYDLMSMIAQLSYALSHGLGLSIQRNIETILKSILNANPNAKIYVMGYYNPLPLLSQYGMDLTIPAIYFNTFIYRAIWNVRCCSAYYGASLNYVDTLLTMSNGVNKGYLSPLDIHPTAFGYQTIANLFMKKISIDLQ